MQLPLVFYRLQLGMMVPAPQNHHHCTERMHTQAIGLRDPGETGLLTGALISPVRLPVWRCPVGAYRR
jgi:hypothetical protein